VLGDDGSTSGRVQEMFTPTVQQRDLAASDANVPRVATVPGVMSAANYGPAPFPPAAAASQDGGSHFEQDLPAAADRNQVDGMAGEAMSVRATAAPVDDLAVGKAAGEGNANMEKIADLLAPAPVGAEKSKVTAAADDLLAENEADEWSSNSGGSASVAAQFAEMHADEELLRRDPKPSDRRRKHDERLSEHLAASNTRPAKHAAPRCTCPAEPTALRGRRRGGDGRSGPDHKRPGAAPRVVSATTKRECPSSEAAPSARTVRQAPATRRARWKSASSEEDWPEPPAAGQSWT